MNIEKLKAERMTRQAYQTKMLKSVISGSLAGVLLILIIIFLSGTVYENRGIFEVISHSDNGLISLSSTADFQNPSTYLECETAGEMTNISGERDLPADVDTVADGSHNGDNYFAYTFYLQNVAENTIDVEERIDMTGKFKGAEQAVRIKIYRDGVSTTYATPSKSGLPEYGTVAFLDEDTVYSRTVENLAPGETAKYTIVVWLEGDDPECVNDIMGGYARFAMEFKVINGSDKQAV